MDILNEHQWMLALVYASAFLALYFYYLCYTTRVLESFGRKALDNSSMSYLFLLGCVPALYLFTLMESPNFFHITNPTVGVFVLMIGTLSAKSLMKWLAQGIRIPFKAELDE